jgi:hypothetical protein
MRFIRSRGRSVLLFAATIALMRFGASPSSAQQAKSNYLSPPGYIAGVVQGEKGPEAGVWVIADTKDLGTQMIKIVVTDDNGKFVLPELPGATYKVWVRGYGLVDSAPVDAKPSATQLTLKVTSAKTPQEAAKVYPGDYWLSMLEPPAKNLFPGTGPDGNGLGRGMTDQDHWINSLKSGCNFCHQLGNALTRDTKHVFAAKPELKTDTEAWEWRLGVGVRGTNMYSLLGQMGKEPTLHALSNWTERIEKGEVPPAPPRPSGIERRPFLHARPDFDRQEHSYGQRRRTQLRGKRRPRPAGGSGHEGQQHLRARYSDPRSQGQGSFAFPVSKPSVHVLGRRASVGESSLRSGRSAQSDDRQQGPGVDDVEDSRQHGPVLVQRCFAE